MKQGYSTPARRANRLTWTNTTCKPSAWTIGRARKSSIPISRTGALTLTPNAPFAVISSLPPSTGRTARYFTNLAFPLSLPAWPGKQIVGLEERSRPNAEGKTAYKGMAAGSNATKGMWIAQLNSHRSDVGFNIPLSGVKDVYWFESAFDAMAFYQIEKKGNCGIRRLGKRRVRFHGRHAERAGSLPGCRSRSPDANHHLCFDRDQRGTALCRELRLADERDGYSTRTHDQERHLGCHRPDREIRAARKWTWRTFDFDAVLQGTRLGERKNIDYRPPSEGYKDWNDQLLDKRMDESMEQDNTKEKQTRFRR